MGYKEIFARISSGDMGGIFVFHGPEEYVKDRALEALKARLVPAELEPLNFLLLENEHACAAEIRRASETLPFMTEKRLVVVRDYPMLAKSSRGSGLDTKQENAELEQLTRRFPDTTCLVFLMRAEPDTTKAAWKQLVKSASIVVFDRLNEEELAAQLAKLAKRHDCTIGRDAARYMIQYCGTDLEQLNHEMEKACAHAGAGHAVGRENIDAVCIQTQESKVFQVIDNLFAGQGSLAMAKLRTLTEEDDGAIAMMSLIERQARILTAVKAAGRGADARALAPLLGAPPFAVEAAARQASRWTGEELGGIISMCVQADTGIKQGIMGEQTAVEQLAMNVVYLAGKRRG